MVNAGLGEVQRIAEEWDETWDFDLTEISDDQGIRYGCVHPSSYGSKIAKGAGIMFPVIAAIWCTVVFCLWLIACAQDKQTYGSGLVSQYLGAFLLSCVPLGAYKFFLFLFS